MLAGETRCRYNGGVELGAGPAKEGDWMIAPRANSYVDQVLARIDPSDIPPDDEAMTNKQFT
jgi:hypothetical protein